MSSSSFVGRGLQIAKLGLAARDVRNAETDSARDHARRALASIFADARGVTMKFGQLMAGDGEDDPFKELVTSVEPLPLTTIAPFVEAELGHALADVFSTFDEATHAASLGQVHQARLIGSDARVAVKVQYPHIASAVENEMRLFGLMPGVGPVRKWGFDLGGYKHALKANMDRELSYLDEAARQERFRHAVDVDGLVIPRVYSDISTDKVLVQDWQTGVSLDEAATWSSSVRRQLGRTLLASLFKSLFDVGEIHGDPHPGNYAFRASPQGDGSVVLMDFGCTVPVDRQHRLALLRTIIAVRDGEEVTPLDAFAAMGFDADKLALISGSLATLAHILFAPFIGSRPFFVRQWDLKARFEALLGENRWWFRASGPPSHILLLRGFQGLAQQLDTLKCGVNWWDVLTETVSPAVMAEARAMQFPKVPDAISARATTVPTSMRLAEHLHVHVREGSREIVSMSMPAEAVFRLDDMIPEDVTQYLDASDDWDVAAILDGVRAQGIVPQEVLNFNNGPKQYRIWLE